MFIVYLFFYVFYLLMLFFLHVKHNSAWFIYFFNFFTNASYLTSTHTLFYSICRDQHTLFIHLFPNISLIPSCVQIIPSCVTQPHLPKHLHTFCLFLVVSYVYLLLHNRIYFFIHILSNAKHSNF